MTPFTISNHSVLGTNATKSLLVEGTGGNWGEGANDHRFSWASRCRRCYGGEEFYPLTYLNFRLHPKVHVAVNPYLIPSTSQESNKNQRTYLELMEKQETGCADKETDAIKFHAKAEKGLANGTLE